MTVAEMEARLLELNDEAVEIQALADVEKRDLTDEEQETLTEKLDECAKIEGQKELRVRLEAQTKTIQGGEPGTSTGEHRKTAALDPGKSNEAGVDVDARHVRVTDRSVNDPTFGWRSYGDFGQAVREGSMQGATPDDRLIKRAALATFANEGVGADGGFAVPPAFQTGIKGVLTDEEGLLARTDQQTSSSNQFVVPTDETTPWGTTGVQATWEGESDAIAQSKPVLTQKSLRLNKLAVLVPVTEELADDAPSLANYLNRKAPEAIRQKVDNAIVGGNGSGQPLGIINAPGTIAVAKEGSQTADTIVEANVRKMWTRCLAVWRRNSIWIANQDIETQLMQMYFIDQESTPLSTSPIYLPQGGFAAAPFATLFGKEILYVQASETLGDLGDIILADLNQYLTVSKTGGIRAEMSIHLWFDQDTTAFKFVMRLAGQPWWGSTIAARDGSTTYSPFVTLAERA